MTTAKSIWDEAKSSLEQTIQSFIFDVFIKHLEPVEIKNTKLVLAAPTETIYNAVTTNHFAEIVEAVTSIKNGFIDGVEIVLLAGEGESTWSDSTEMGRDAVVPEPTADFGMKFNSKYTFDSYVVGESNNLVNAAAHAVAENPGQKWNPLFIYGGVGLGKTHLMHAIGNYLLAHNKNMKIAYTTAEKFMNEFIGSIAPSRDNSMSQRFKDRYRSVDVLMIDDIQFIEKREATQNELFHTFNELYNNNKQIILTSDRMPKDIPDLTERLRTRFEWGLIADIQPPSLETKIAILQMKAAQERYRVPHDVLTLIAERVESNIREMESLLSRVALFASLKNDEITMPLAQEALRDYSDHKKAQMSTDSIIDAVCKYYSVTRDDLVGKKKNKEIVEPRQIAIYLINEFLSLPLASIGSILGGRDHTTIIHARDKIAERLKNEPRLAAQVNDIRSIISGE